jgi:hypothetical protein
MFRGVCRLLPRTPVGGSACSTPVSCSTVAPATVARFCATKADEIRTAWDEQSWRERFSGTIEGNPYTCYVVPSDDRPEAGVMMRIAERGDPPVRVAVLMDMFDDTTDRRHLRRLLRLVAQAADDAGCAGVLAVEQGPPEVAAAMRAAGYWRTSERYSIVAKATGADPLPTSLTVASAWKFNFAEHDAF